ncbi:MAG: hypothetical protein ACI8QZ_002395 [Chlamydiales bacterium]|jgi:hypothetical protein
MPNNAPRAGLLAISLRSATLLSAAAAVFLLACSSGSRIGSPFSPIAHPPELEREEASATEMHQLLFEEDNYPTARTCAKCHPDHYREWAVSPHAYSQLSPVFNAFHGAVVALTNGTFSEFCIRCHNQVGVQKDEPLFESNLYRHPSSREGITCIVCHRLPADSGKVSGRFSIERGDIYDPVYGPTDGTILAEAIEEHGLETESYPGAKKTDAVHSEVSSAGFLTESSFCGVCHDVNLGTGFRLEEAFSEYKSSPAAKNGVSCQDCHMGKQQGVFLGEDNYHIAPAAIVAGITTAPRKRTDHMFPGPDYSIIHPGLFPHLPNEKLAFANMGEWLAFDHEAGWGTSEFEKNVPEGMTFPEPWDVSGKRVQAAQILEDQYEQLDIYDQARIDILKVGFVMGDIVVEQSGTDGIEFKVHVKNGTDGHNVPTGFIAERTLYLEVTVTDPQGEVVYKSGDLDPNGDVRDSHSVYVHNGELPVDEALFSLQSKFIVRMTRGGEREQVLAVNHSVDPLPFLRPAPFSTILTGRPRGARTHRVNIPPLGERWPEYKVRPEAMSGSGTYEIHVRMISGMVPPNLINAIQIVGFDYGMSARDVGDAVVAGRVVLWDKTLTVDI